jgi:hypothetical protein
MEEGGNAEIFSDYATTLLCKEKKEGVASKPLTSEPTMSQMGIRLS